MIKKNLFLKATTKLIRETALILLKNKTLMLWNIWKEGCMDSRWHKGGKGQL